MQKRIISACLCLLLLFSFAQPAAASAENATPAVLYKLLEKFPHKAYWNHVGSEKNNPDGVTGFPCPSYSGCSWQENGCTCNSFLNAIQCKGFAYKASYDIVGTNPRDWNQRDTLDPSKLCVGDIIRYRGNGHSATVTGVNGDIISIVDANWYPMCQIRWDQLKASEIPGFSYVLHDPKNNLKNKNVDFYLDATEKAEKALQKAALASEQWTSSETLNMRKTATTKADILGKVPPGTRLVVSSKKVNDGYLWGKVVYGTAVGWVALDYCKYNSGAVNAPSFTDIQKIQPLGESFNLTWKKVDGSDKYTVYIYDEDGSCVEEASVKTNFAEFMLTKAGEYSAVVESQSSAAPSWQLKSSKLKFSVLPKTDIQIETIDLNKTSLTVAVGEAVAVKATVTPCNADSSALVWRSSNGNAVTVDNSGTVEAKSYGSANVTCCDPEEKLSASCSVTVVPSAPKNVHQVTSQSSTDFVTLKWNKVAGVDGYLVYRKKSSGAYSLVASVNTNTYTDTPLSSSKEFTYIIKAFVVVSDEKLTGFKSEEASAATKPQKPTGLTVTASGNTVKLKWKKSSRVDSYYVYQRTSKDSSYKKIKTVSSNTYSKKIKSGTTVYFRVKAVKTVKGKNFISAYSDTKKIKIK